MLFYHNLSSQVDKVSSISLFKAITHDSSESTVPVGLIVGGVLGAIALLAITTILILVCMWCCKAKPIEHKDENETKRSHRFQATKCFPSTKCVPNCLILGQKTGGKEKFKGDGKYTGNVTS